MKITALKALAVVMLIASVVLLGGYGVMAQSLNDTGTDGGFNTTNGTSNTNGINSTSDTSGVNDSNTTNSADRSMTSTSSSNGIGTGLGTVNTTSTTTTPGVPNTGAGGDATMNLVLLLGSAVLAAGGLIYMIRGFQAR